MPHQALQDLQWNTGIQHMHRIGVAECMWCDKNRERHTVSSSGGNRFPNPGPDCSVRHFPDPHFLCSAGATVTPLHGDFQCCHHRLQLAEVPGIRDAEPAGESAYRPAIFLPFWLSFRSVVSGSQAAQTDTEARAKNPPVSAPVLH